MIVCSPLGVALSDAVAILCVLSLTTGVFSSSEFDAVSSSSIIASVGAALTVASVTELLLISGGKDIRKVRPW